MPDEIAIARACAILGDDCDTWCRASGRRQFSDSDDSKCNRAGAAGAAYLCQILDVTNCRSGSATFEAEGTCEVSEHNLLYYYSTRTHRELAHPPIFILFVIFFDEKFRVGVFFITDAAPPPKCYP